MKTAYISLGPTCVPAEILKASGLRTCTFGFDWLRSGSFYIEEFMRMELHCFVERYVANPCIPLRQCISTAINHAHPHTIEPSVIRPLFGYNYLYNPHKDLNDPLTVPYMKRAFSRLKNVIQDKSIIKRYIITDYTNKHHASHISSIPQVVNWFKALCTDNGLTGELYIVRITLEPNKIYQIEKNKESDLSGMKIYSISVKYWQDLDNKECRTSAYRKLGRFIFGPVEANMIWST